MGKKKSAADKSESPSKGPATEIIVGVVLALLVGTSAPWWWAKIFPSSAADCSTHELKERLSYEESRSEVIVKASKDLRERFRRQHFDCVYELAAVLIEDDPENGHGLYFSGEVWRVRATEPQNSALARKRMREHFFRYISAEKDLTDTERDGDGKACYKRSKGYCAERTAWISHLMAIDYNKQAEEAADKATKLQYLQRAEEFLERDLKYGGFDQIIPSKVLQGKIRENREKLTGS